MAYEGDNGYAALVAEVEVDQANGRVEARRFVVALDCGPISKPNGLLNQIEGGVLQGTSRALGEEITWDDRKVTSIDWQSYNTLPLESRCQSSRAFSSTAQQQKRLALGKLVITLAAAAIGNANFDATGARIRKRHSRPIG